MPNNTARAREVSQLALIEPSVLQRSFESAESKGEDLLELLVLQRLLTPQQAQMILTRLGETKSSSILSSGVQSPEKPVHGKLSEKRYRLVDQLRELRKQSKYFSPRIDLDYERKEKLGEGGMGVVHRVTDRTLERQAALKVLLDDKLETRQHARFIREAQITARLDHPSIPPVYEFGTNVDGQPCLVMRVIEGVTLKKKIRQVHQEFKGDPKKVRGLLECLLKVGEAIDYAHSRDIIHRDLKPSNIMIGRFGQVMVMDWGLARDLHSQSESVSSFTNTDQQELSEIIADQGVSVDGATIGTPGYMPPEQISGKSSKESDIYSLGLILCEVLTGQRALQGDSVMEKVMATVRGEIVYPRSVNKSVDRDIDELVRCMTARQSERRLESAALFCAELKSYLTGELLSTVSYNSQERFLWWARNRSRTLSAFSAVLLILGSIALAMGLFIRAQ